MCGCGVVAISGEFGVGWTSEPAGRGGGLARFSPPVTNKLVKIKVTDWPFSLIPLVSKS